MEMGLDGRKWVQVARNTSKRVTGVENRCWWVENGVLVLEMGAGGSKRVLEDRKRVLVARTG